MACYHDIDLLCLALDTVRQNITPSRRRSQALESLVYIYHRDGGQATAAAAEELVAMVRADHVVRTAAKDVKA